MTDSTSFQEELFQEVKNKADSEGVYKNDAFFDLITDYLCDAGEFDEAIPAFCQRTGIRATVAILLSQAEKSLASLSSTSTKILAC